MIAKELDHVEIEKEKLNIERMGIIEDRAIRDREWSEIKNFIDDLNIQRKKLQEQRELLEKVLELEVAKLAKKATEEAIKAQSTIHNKSRQIQSRGINCNSTFDKELIADVNGEFLIPSNVLSVIMLLSRTGCWL